MINKSWAKPAIFIFIMASLLSCRATNKEYEQFSRAGNSYAVAIDNLLVASNRIIIDANSERLLRNRLENPYEPSVNAENYDEATKLDDQWLRLIGRLRTHAGILKLYFAELEKLATSNAPQNAGDATGELVTELANTGQKIRIDPLYKPLAQSVGTIVVGLKVNNALRRELVLRKDVIQKELNTENSVLILLTEKLNADLSDLQNNQDYRTTFKEFVANQPIANPDEWIDKRRTIRNMSTTIEELQGASKASQDFNDAFKAVLEDKLTLERGDFVLSEINSLLAAAEDLKNQSEKKS